MSHRGVRANHRDLHTFACGGRQRKFPNPFNVFGFFRYAGVASCALMASWAYAAFYAMVILVPRTYVTVRRALGCGSLVQAKSNMKALLYRTLDSCRPLGWSRKSWAW